MPSPFTEFFRAATGGRDPYPYQERFATAAALPHLLRAPTGAGKTAAAVLGWLWRRKKTPGTPRRLVYCLPMRVLVEQSSDAAATWIANLREQRVLGEPVAVHRLMGGADAEEWFLHPERPAVLVGTQDMLLSRALNRGYAASRFHWPVDFGLLNNDALWVFDEPQLMGSGVGTSAQLAGLRAALGTFGGCPSVWMSATLEPDWLDTVDFRGKFPGAPHALDDEDYADPRLDKRMTAAKALAPLGVTLTKEADDKEAQAVARAVLEEREPGTQTLVVMNTVKRAKAVYRALEKLAKPPARLLLVHSRFRPFERDELNRRLQEGGAAAADRVIVATQVVEAGVDISARTLVTELAPWASVVQRVGRCNRTGDDGPGRVFWIDQDETKLALPYEAADLAFARGHLAKWGGASVSPKALDDYKRANEQPDEPFLRFEHTHVVRRRDVLDLFDTAPDLSGNDIDVQRFVRGDDPETDVQVFWRAGRPDPKPGAVERRAQTPRRAELCNVPIGSFKKDYLEAGRTAYRWDFLDKEWKALTKRDAASVVPGQVFWLDAGEGGYDPQLGWEPAATTAVPVVPPDPDDAAKPARDDTAYDTDDWSRLGWQTVAEHTGDVARVMADLLAPAAGLPVTPSEAKALRVAVRYHDWGKAHAAFQSAIRADAVGRRGTAPLPRPAAWKGFAFVAKAPDEFWGRPARRRFRHEAASALGVLALLGSGAVPPGLADLTPDERDLAVFLVLGHHGKVRLSLRTVPGEKPPPAPDTLFAAGVWHGDGLPETDLGDGVTAPAVSLDLTPMRLGGASWTARALALRDRLGPFRLAYLEALMRAADCRASQSPTPSARSATPAAGGAGDE